MLYCINIFDIIIFIFGWRSQNCSEKYYSLLNDNIIHSALADEIPFRIMETPVPLARPTKSKYLETEPWRLHIRCPHRERRHWKVWTWPGRKPNCPAFWSRPFRILAEWPSLSLLHSPGFQCLMYKVGPLTFMSRQLRRMNKVPYDVMFSLTVRQTFKKWCWKVDRVNR